MFSRESDNTGKANRRSNEVTKNSYSIIHVTKQNDILLIKKKVHGYPPYNSYGAIEQELRLRKM